MSTRPQTVQRNCPYHRRPNPRGIVASVLIAGKVCVAIERSDIYESTSFMTDSHVLPPSPDMDEHESPGGDQTQTAHRRKRSVNHEL